MNSGLSKTIVSPKRIILHSLLKVFSFYVISGNLLRLIPLPGIQTNTVITEFVIYLFSFLALPFIANPFSRSFFLLCLIISLSSAWGALKYGFHFASALYAIRLILMLASGIVLGRVLYEKFGSSFASFSQYIQSLYIKNLSIGLAILFLFPNSTLFWVFMNQIGIEFNGDPHHGRLVSPYLDPNFFGAICCIPWIFSYSLYQRHRRTKDLLLCIFFSLGIIFTWSRSGIATFALLLAGIFFVRLCSKLFLFNKSALVCLTILSLGGALTFLFCFDSAQYFFHRLIHMSNDPSAYGRFQSFSIGLSLIYENPLLGMGYNYLLIYLLDFGKHSALHSSLFTTAITFGLPLLFGILTLFAVWAFQMMKRIASLNPQDRSLVRLLLFYLMICIVFSANFNNLLYYPFWLLPITVIFSYLSSCKLKT